MRNILEQLIINYPNNPVVITLNDGTIIGGRRLGAVLNAPNAGTDGGILQLLNTQGNSREALSICQIAAVNITGITYPDNLTYLPEPAVLPTGCCADCEAATRAYLPVGTENINVRHGAITLVQGEVTRNEYGMLVITSPAGANPTFVSTCDINVMDKSEAALTA